MDVTKLCLTGFVLGSLRFCLTLEKLSSKERGLDNADEKDWEGLEVVEATDWRRR